MKQFFEEYGGVIIILIVVAVLLAILGNGGTDSGIAGTVYDAITETVSNFKGFLDGVTIPGAPVAPGA